MFFHFVFNEIYKLLIAYVQTSAWLYTDPVNGVVVNRKDELGETKTKRRFYSQLLKRSIE